LFPRALPSPFLLAFERMWSNRRFMGYGSWVIGYW
jgi:hypothetical protein